MADTPHGSVPMPVGSFPDSSTDVRRPSHAQSPNWGGGEMQKGLVTH